MAPKKNIKKNSAISKLALERIKKVQEEEERIKKQIEEEERAIKEEQERLKKLEEERLAELERKRIAKREKILKQKREGTYKTPKEKEKYRMNQLKLQGLINSSQVVKKFESQEDIIENKSFSKINIDSKLRSPIICVMGHVDTGKTKLLDKLRNSNVQSNEIGGITQQIGFTQFSLDIIQQYVKNFDVEINIPGLLIIDTPGHEAFSNIRQNGTKFADLVILVIDIVRGVQQQTIECIKLFNEQGINFVIALNKIDRLYEWKNIERTFMKEKISLQNENTRQEFNDKLSLIILELNKLEINTDLYWNIIDNDYIPIIPISVLNNQGLDELILNIISFTQNIINKQLEFKDDLECYVIDNKIIEGYGNLIDVILINGNLKEGQEIYLESENEYIKSKIKLLLSNPINSEMRVKNEFITHKNVKGAMGLKIALHDTITPKVGSKININYLPIEILDKQSDDQFNFDQEGIIIYASTSNSLMALFKFLKDECKPSIPIIDAKIGTISKKDILKMSIMKIKEEHKVILAFDINIDEEINEFAIKNNIKILKADVIYHLFDLFKNHLDSFFKNKKKELEEFMVYPCSLKIINIFNKKNPIVLGVEIIDGSLHMNTPLFIPKNNLYLGKVIGIQNNHIDVNKANKGDKIAIKIETENQNLQYGRHFNNDCEEIISMISRKSIDVLKEFYKEEITKEELLLIVKLKKILKIT